MDYTKKLLEVRDLHKAYSKAAWNSVGIDSKR